MFNKSLKANKLNNYMGLLFLIAITYLAFVPLKPHHVSVDDVVESNFHIKNAFEHVVKMTNKPHYIGSKGHSVTQSYVIEQLQQLGLQVEIQSTNIASSRNTFSHVENIITKIYGSDKSAKSLVLMSHYDSAPTASFGAADAASGVATILEGVRAYLEQNTSPKNDIIILITDGEEMGLLGAKAFVKKHQWANNIGVVLNFEARGSAGSSYLLMETNHGNRKLLEAYTNAELDFSSSDSLGYSIYKSLPNDTDLTVFRVDKDIVGYNFAFIDDHFNYHTALDTAENLSLDSLAYQAHYLMPLLRMLSQIDLNSLQSDGDDVYFQVPYWKTLSYPFEWAMTISLLSLVAFIFVLILGVRNHSLKIKSIFAGFLPLSLSLITTGLLSFIILELLYWIHPQYSEILQGFTYNGHAYILFFSLFAINICYFFYRFAMNKYSSSELIVAPIFLWMLVSFATSAYLTGAHHFTLFSIAGTAILLFNVITNKINPSLVLILFAVILLIFAPLAQLPIALGVKLLPYSGLLLVLIFSVFISCVQIPEQRTINHWVFIVPLVCSLIYAETNASISPERPRPNSLYYFQDKDSGLAYWMNYDNKTDKWNESFFSANRLDADQLTEFKKHSWSTTKTVSTTENRHVSEAKIDVIVEEKLSDRYRYQLKISPQRAINFISLINNKEIHLLRLAVNGEVIYEGESKTINSGEYFCSIIRTTEDDFTLDIEILADEPLDLNVLEISSDLLESNVFNIPRRPKEYIAKPFITSDSIITKQRIFL